ncbi:MAG: serine hydroxymethyltransferase, partial [Oscillospiraceae bacterium]
KNTVPQDPETPFVTSGVRIGTPAVTTRGFKEAEMALIAHFIAQAVFDFDNSKAEIIENVKTLVSRFPLYE